MADTSDSVRSVDNAASVTSFDWRDLHFHVVTAHPLTDEQVTTITRTLPNVASVGLFADVLSMILGRYVRIRTQRPSSDVWFEVGR